jgi:hypothetical protein
MREMKTIIRRGLGSRRVLRALAGMLAALILVAGLSLANDLHGLRWRHGRRSHDEFDRYRGRTGRLRKRGDGR